MTSSDAATRLANLAQPRISFLATHVSVELPHGQTWQSLYGGGPTKVWNVDAAEVLRHVAAKQPSNAGCAWSLEEWEDGSFTEPNARELALLVRANCDGVDAAKRTRFVIAAARERHVATGIMLVGGRVVFEADVPFARMGGYAPALGSDGRNMVLLDTSGDTAGSARLVRVEHGALITEHDFGKLGIGCPGTPLLSFRAAPGGVEFLDSSQSCDRED